EGRQCETVWLLCRLCRRSADEQEAVERVYESARRRFVCCRRLGLAVAGAATLTAAGACRAATAHRESHAAAFIRIGVAQLSPTDSPLRGFRQLSQNYSVESFLRPDEEGRLQPLL